MNENNRLSQAGAYAALEAVLPPATNRYIALLTTLPDVDGDNAVEVAADGYARQVVDSWQNGAFGDGIYARVTAAPVSFGGFVQEDIVGWAVYDASEGGNLLYWGQLLTRGDGQPVSRSMYQLDELTFDGGEIGLFFAPHGVELGGNGD